MAARVFRASQSLEELSKGFYGHWKDGKWVHAVINGLRKEILLSRERARTEELMKKMSQMLFDHKVPGWREEHLFVRGQQFCTGGFSDLFSAGGQTHGLRGSIHSQQWSYLFARSFATLKGTSDRRKRDLAQREFQLLRRKTKLLKATLSPEEKLLWRLKKANRKKAVLLQRLKKYELEEDPEPVHDPELITAEQLQALKKIGYKNRNYVPVGRRGVYGGVVQNMHMHWKFHETVQVDCHIFKRDDIRSVARQLAILSGGIVIDIHQATTIIMYRGRNYKQPKKQMIPPNTLSKRKALFKSKFLQALEGLETNILNIEGELQAIRRKQKQSNEQGTGNDLSKTPQTTNDQMEEHNLLAKLSEVSSDDDEEDGLFSWDSDSLDEDELSDDDGGNLKDTKEFIETKTTKTVSQTTGDLAPQSGKKNRPTAKELILAEQELFRSKRQAEAAQQREATCLSGGKSKNVDLYKGLETDDDGNECEKGDGVAKSDRHAERLEIISRGSGQIKNRKIAKFMEDLMTDSEEMGGLRSDFDDLDDNRNGTGSIENIESCLATESDVEK